MSSGSNAQGVVELRGRADSLKQPYTLAIREFLSLSGEEFNALEAERQLLEIHRLATAYFNATEGFVGNSSLMGAHGDPEWVLGFAEDCHAVLEAIAQHYTFLRATCDRFSLDYSQFQPSATAFGGMQRMVKRYIPDAVPPLASTLSDLAVPTRGFRATLADPGSSLPAIASPDPTDASPPNEGNAAVEFGPHGIARATGLRSEDAVRIATGLVPHAGSPVRVQGCAWIIAE